MTESHFPQKTKRLEKFQQIDIYPVVSSEFTAGRSDLDVLSAIIAGGAKIVQLREKALSKRDFFLLAEQFRTLTNKHDVLLIINDHLDIALGVDADGVHLGQDDLPLEVARRLAPDMIIGASTHNQREADLACRQGADYVNLGPIYATQTKSLSMNPLGPEIITTVGSRLDIPFTVMGGIKERHIPELMSLGASKIAMVTEITQAEDIEERVKQLRGYFSL